MPAPGSAQIAETLRRTDPRLAHVIERVGPITMRPRGRGFPALVRAIIYQQISGAAGNAIHRRVAAHGSGNEVPDPSWFLDTPVATLRAAGLSPQKIGYLQDLARRVRDGSLDFDALEDLDDEAAIERLGAVRGIGRWTAQMYLMFNLGRPDVWPSGDLGLRKAVQRLQGMRALPAERTVDRVGRKWAPFRTHAAYYLWRSLENVPAIERPTRSRAKRATAASRRTATRRRRRRRSR